MPTGNKVCLSPGPRSLGDPVPLTGMAAGLTATARALNVHRPNPHGGGTACPAQRRVAVCQNFQRIWSFR
jgi:hypothetical protein